MTAPSHRAWKDAIKAGHTFVSYDALCDLRVESVAPGGRIALKGSGTLHVEWTVASATIPVTLVELIVSGELVDGAGLDGMLGSRDGIFRVNIQQSAWIALRVRGRLPGKPEIIIAHTSAVMVNVAGILS